MSDISELTKWLRDNSSGVYRKSAEAADVIEAQGRKIAEQRQEIKLLTGQVNFLVNCHAANAECPPKSLSKHNRRRFKGILEKAVEFITGKRCPSHQDLTMDREWLLKRCQTAIEELEV